MSAPNQFQQWLAGLPRHLGDLAERVAGLESQHRALQELSGEPRSDIGPIQSYLQDVYNLAPEVVRTEHLRFELHLVDGTVDFESPSRKVDPEFVFALRRLSISGWSAAPVENWANPSITFNLEDQGRARGGLFNDPISIAETADHNGNVAMELVWDAFYGFVPGADIKGIWAFDPTLFPAESGEIRIVARVTGDVLRTRTLPGGAMITSQRGRQR